MGRVLGAASGRPGTTRRRVLISQLEVMVEALEEAGFVSTDTIEEKVVMPGTKFLVAGSGGGEPPYDLGGFTRALAAGLGTQDASVVVAEANDSGWGIVQGVRADEAAREAASTVDHADTPWGAIAVILELERAGDPPVYHTGYDAGATSALPTPIPAD